MSYHEYKKMMIDDIRENPEWYFDLLGLKTKRIEVLTLLSDQRINQYFRTFIIKRYQKLLGDSLEKFIDKKQEGYLWEEKKDGEPGKKIEYSELTPVIKKGDHYFDNEFGKWPTDYLITISLKIGDNARSLLNKNQYEIFDLTTNKGLNDKDISKLKGVQIRTIQNTQKRIYEKLSNAVEDELLKKKSDYVPDPNPDLDLLDKKYDDENQINRLVDIKADIRYKEK